MTATQRKLVLRGFVLLSVVVAASILLQRSLLAGVRDALATDPDLRAKSLSAGRVAAATWGVAEWWDVLAIGVLSAAFTVACAAEIRTRAVRRWIEAAVAQDRTTCALSVLLTLLAVRWMLDPAPIVRHDGQAHVGLVALVAESLQQGEGPWWSFRWYGGFPLLSEYGCGFHVAAACASFLTQGAESGVRVVVLAAALATPLAVASCARALGCSRPSALVAGVSVVLSFQFTHTIAWTGKFPDAIFYLLFPLAVRSAVRMGGPSAVGDGARFGLWCGVMGIVHPGLGPVAASIAAVVGLVAVAVQRGQVGLRRAARSLVVAVVVAAFLTVPPIVAVLRDRSWLLVGRDGLQTAGVFQFGAPDVGVLSSLLTWHMGWTSDVFAYLGITLVVGGTTGAVIGVLRSQRPALAVIAGLLVTIPCIGGGYLVSRSIACVVVLLALGLASWVETAVRRGVGAGGAVLLVLTLLAADLGPTTLQAPGMPGGPGRARHLARLREEAGGGRYIRLGRRGGELGFHTTDNPLDTRLDTPLGSLVYMGGSPWTPFTLSILNEGSSRLARSSRIDGWTVRALALQGVSVVAEDARIRWGPIQATHIAPDGRDLLEVPPPGAAGARIRAASAVTFGDTVVVAPKHLTDELAHAPFSVYESERERSDTRMRAAVRGLIDAMGLDALRPEAARLLASDTATRDALLEAGAGPCRGTAGTVRSGPSEWSCDVDVHSAGVVRLALAWSPHLRVRVDGREPPVGPFPDATGAVLVALPRGARQISVVATDRGPWPAWLVAAAVAAVAFSFALRRPHVA